MVIWGQCDYTWPLIYSSCSYMIFKFFIIWMFYGVRKKREKINLLLYRHWKFFKSWQETYYYSFCTKTDLFAHFLSIWKPIFLNVESCSHFMSVYVRKHCILGDTFMSALLSQTTANCHAPEINTQSVMIR